MRSLRGTERKEDHGTRNTSAEGTVAKQAKFSHSFSKVL